MDDKKVVPKREPGTDGGKRKGGMKNKSHRRDQNKNVQVQPMKSKNVGKTEELDGFMYDVGSNSQAQLFTDTTREIAEYAGRNLKESQDIRRAIENLVEMTFTLPTRANIGDVSLNKAIFNKQLDNHFKRENSYRQNRATMSSVVFGQCTDAMRAKLEGDSRFEVIKDNSDVIELLKLIRDIAYDVEADR